MTNPEGELVVNGSFFVVENEYDCAEVIATYINAEGLYKPTEITLEPRGEQGDVIDKKYIHFQLPIGIYTIKAGPFSQTVEVRLKSD